MRWRIAQETRYGHVRFLRLQWLKRFTDPCVTGISGLTLAPNLQVSCGFRRTRKNTGMNSVFPQIWTSMTKLMLSTVPASMMLYDFSRQCHDLTGRALRFSSPYSSSCWPVAGLL